MMVKPGAGIFVGRRADTALDAWQMPQGGVDEGEALESAARRELEEETCAKTVKIHGRTKGWFYYDLPASLIGKVWQGRFRGQKQIWFLMEFLGQDEEIDLNAHTPEFTNWRWAKPGELPDCAVPFKRAVYEAVGEAFKDQLLKII